MAFGDYRASSGAGAKDNSGAANSLAVAFGVNNTAGDILTAAIYFGSAGGSNTFANSGSITDTNSNTWTRDSGTEQTTNGLSAMRHVINCAGGANTATLHINGVAPMAIVVTAYDAAGGGSGVTLDASNVHTGLTAPLATAGSVTPSGNGCLVVAMGSNDFEASTWTAGTALSFTVRASAAYTPSQVSIEDAVQASAGAVNADLTGNHTNDNYAMAVLVFKPASGAAVTIPSLTVAPITSY